MNALYHYALYIIYTDLPSLPSHLTSLSSLPNHFILYSLMSVSTLNFHILLPFLCNIPFLIIIHKIHTVAS